jgi:cytoskeletal protein RodZ
VWGKLPAPVYVRGFLAEYARALGLDSDRVKQTYLDRYRAARGHVADADDEAAKP